LTQLKAPTAALKSYIERQKNGTLANGVYIEIGKSVAEIKAKRELLRDIAPTAQRLAKGGLTPAPVYNPQGIQIGRQYRAKGPVEHYKEAWPEDVSTAFSAYIMDAHAADQMGLTISYDGNTSRGSVSKLGGLGNVHDRQRDAYARLEWIRARITWDAVKVLDWLVLEVRREATGQNMGLVDVGHQLFPVIRDKATSKGIAIGALLLAGKELARAYRIHETISRDHRR
jgi:hypothetical protein